MPNRNYIRGVRAEREAVNFARQEGQIAFRSAGSHSPYDVVTIDEVTGIIRFIQFKVHKRPKHTGYKITATKPTKNMQVHFLRKDVYTR